MSFPEIADAVKALSRAEKVRLLHELVDAVSTPPDGSPEEAVLSTVPPGKTFEVWFPEANTSAVATALQALLEEDRES